MTYLLAVALSFFTSVLTLYAFFNFGLKTVDVVYVISRFEERLAVEVYEGLTPEEAKRRREAFLKALRKALSEEKGIILTKQTFLKGGPRDVTERVFSRALSLYKLYKGGDKRR